MEPILPKIIAVVGTTASGKSALAIELAKAYNGEIVSVDSRQIYKEMDIGTNKEPGELVVGKPSTDVLRAPLPADCPVSIQEILSNVYMVENIPHYMISIVRPDQLFTLAHFKAAAEAVIADIMRRGKLPILVGGTALYTTAILNNWQIPETQPDTALRTELQTLTTDELVKRLGQLDPARVETIDIRNRRRLFRAIEIAVYGQQGQAQVIGEKKYDALLLAPLVKKDVLYKRINDRVDAMAAAGLVEEVKAVGEKYGYDCVAMTGHAYQQISQSLKGEMSLEGALDLSKKVTRAYAKRQLTWWKKYGPVKWVQSTDEAIKAVEAFLK
jgi:tRNA dimethylallyltransferase